MVEFETYEDLKRAVGSLDGTDFKGAHVNCVADVFPTLLISAKRYCADLN
jgi:hypothetical protein